MILPVSNVPCISMEIHHSRGIRIRMFYEHCINFNSIPSGQEMVFPSQIEPLRTVHEQSGLRRLFRVIKE